MTTVNVEELDKLRIKIKNVFEEIEYVKSPGEKSSGWKERLLFDMLESLKTGNRSKFLWLLLKTLTPYREKHDVRELLEILTEMHIVDAPEKTFEKVAYTIVMGIMSSRDIGGE